MKHEGREREPVRMDNCPDCLGDGFSKGPGAEPLGECKTCDGQGWVPAKPIVPPLDSN
jgi:DnaJ-class molecular chaperone